MKYLILILFMFSCSNVQDNQVKKTPTGACTVMQSTYSNGSIDSTTTYCVQDYTTDLCIGYLGGFKSCSGTSGICINYIGTFNESKTCGEVGYQNNCSGIYKTSCP